MTHSIHILINPAPNQQTQALAVYLQALIEAHRRGEHSYGSMRRACPLCQAK